MSFEHKLEQLYNTYGKKTFQGRNDYEQKRLLAVHLKRSNNALLERQRLERARANKTCLDLIINQTDAGTELYLPLKTGDEGPLASLIKTYCHETLRESSGQTPQEGTYKKFTVLRSRAVESDDLANKLVKNASGRLHKYNVELVPAAKASFVSETIYAAPVADEPSAPATRQTRRTRGAAPEIRHSAKVPGEDVQKIRDYIARGQTNMQIHDQMQAYTAPQIDTIRRHIAWGTYDKEMQVIGEDMFKKLCRDFRGGKSNDDISQAYDLNKFQVIAQRAKYTRLHNRGEV